MPSKKSKKARRTGMRGEKSGKEERGFRVVSAETGQPIYLAAHPEGVSEAEANRLSDGLAVETKVVPVVSPE